MNAVWSSVWGPGGGMVNLDRDQNVAAVEPIAPLSELVEAKCSSPGFVL